MIFMNWRSRSSRAIAPKMRVPRGFFSASIRTTALRSNLTYEPSVRRVWLRVRTMTQRTTSPALTSPPEAAFFTLAMIVSPRPAVRRLYRDALPPRTLMHITSLAPVLSATSSRVCIWIMALTPLLRSGRRREASGQNLHRFVSCLGSTGWRANSRRSGAADKAPGRSGSAGRCGLVLARKRLLGPLADDPYHSPSLELRQRAGLHNLDHVALVRLVGLVVHVAYCPAA